MATLDKIKICGIRSFGCEEEDVQTVRFKKPLTLILGENGCGKSTIIECLRYLTAQKEPAGKGTFVHDPSLTFKPTAKGFVKLRMWDVRGNTVDLCRQVQATRTKKSLTTKSLDNVITRTNKITKEKVSISNRCADFTYEISRIFGVSRSILENVIFCTQEDSHWPLDTDQKLKEKFDQIFDSDKYNKCINKVREKKKKIKDNTKNIEVELKYLKENKNMAVEKRRRVEKTKLQIDSCQEVVKNLNLILEEVENKLKDNNEKEFNMSKNHTAKEMKKAELNQVCEILTELTNRIRTLHTGTDDDLQKELKNFKKQSSMRQEEIQHEENKVKELNAAEEKISNELMEKQGILGKLLKEGELNNERIKEKNKEILKLAAQLNIKEPFQHTEKSLEKLLTDVKIRIMDEEECLIQSKQAFEKEDQDCQSEIDILKEKTLTLQSDIASKTKNVKTSQIQKEKVLKELQEMNRSVSKFNQLESELDSVNAELKVLKDSVDVTNLKDNVKKFVEERNKLEEQLLEVEEQMKKVQNQSSLCTELDVQNQLKLNKDSQFRRLINKHEDNIRLLLGDVPDEKFKAAIQNCFATARQKVKTLTNTKAKKEKEITELEIKRKHIRDKLKLKEDVLRNNEEEIYQICGSDDFEETISIIQRELEELQDIKGTLSSSEFMYQRYIRALQKAKPCCPLCHRDFERQNEVQLLVDELTSKIKEVPSRLQENRTQLEEKQAKYNKLLTFHSIYKETSILKEKEIPDLRLELEKTDSLLKKVQKELVDVGKEINSPQSDEALCLTLQDDMVLLDELQSERVHLEKQIKMLEQRLHTNDANKDNLKKIMSDHENIRRNLKIARQNADDYQSKLNAYNEELQGKQVIRNSLTEELNKIQGGIGKKQILKERLDELGGDEVLLIMELKELEKNYGVLKKKLDEAIVQRKSDKEKRLKEIDKTQHSVNGLLKALSGVETTNEAIESHKTKGIDKRIEEVQKKMKAMEQEASALKIEKEETIKKIERFKKALSNQELVEREMEDNVRLRQKRAQAEILKQEVADLESKFANANFDALLKEKKKLKEREEEITKKKAQTQGRMVEMENHLKILEKELLSKAFRNIDDTYNDEYVKFEVLKAVANDLDRYATAMEYAMMTYHKQQMTKVNAFIREYWRKIYQGNDIDYIEIETDTIESTEKRRNYNYKVVQIKSEVRLDMRNRCSAGQKMLASLIIRLALAETFSNNCGILTLDEPTTNLDRNNIRNLARTLNEVLQAKQNTLSPNFQLIVITHDEEFLKELMELELVNEYVRVDRNIKGKTVISNRALMEDINIESNKFQQVLRSEFEYD